jgi:hypothetical protein
MIYVLENNGDLAWRYELIETPTSQLVPDLDGNRPTDEIFAATGYCRTGTLLASSTAVV